MKITAYDVLGGIVLLAVLLAVSISACRWVSYKMSVNFDKDWAAHSAEQCAPYGVYHSKVSDFSYKCSETLVDSQPETR